MYFFHTAFKDFVSLESQCFSVLGLSSYSIYSPTTGQNDPLSSFLVPRRPAREGSNLARPRGHLIQSLLITLHWAVLLTLSVSMHLGAGCEEAVDTLVLWIQASVLCNPTSEFPMVRSAVRLSHEGSQKHQHTVMHPWSITQT